MAGEPPLFNHPELVALRDAALADLQRRIEAADPRPDDGPDLVLDDICNGTSRRALVAARKDLARARARYDKSVAAARDAGLSWAEIGRLLAVSKQQLHRRYGGQTRRT